MCVVRLDYSNRVVNKGLEDIFPDQVIPPDDEEWRPQSLPPSASNAEARLNISSSEIVSAKEMQKIESISECDEDKTQLMVSSSASKGHPKKPNINIHSPSESPKFPMGSWPQYFQKHAVEHTPDASLNYPTTTTERQYNPVAAGVGTSLAINTPHSTTKCSSRKRLSTYVQDLEHHKEFLPPRRKTVSEFPLVDVETISNTAENKETTSSLPSQEEESSSSTDREVVGKGEGIPQIQWEALLKSVQKPRKTSALDLLLMTESEARQFRAMSPSEFFSKADIPKFPTLQDLHHEHSLFAQPLQRRFHLSSTHRSSLDINRISGINQLGGTSKPLSSTTLQTSTTGNDTSTSNVLSDSPSTSAVFSHEVELSDRPRLRLSESAKCRRVYGAVNKAKWCKQCRWKKACTRFQSLRRTSE